MGTYQPHPNASILTVEYIRSNEAYNIYLVRCSGREWYHKEPRVGGMTEQEIAEMLY